MATKVECFYCGEPARYGFLKVLAGNDEGLFVCQIHVRRALDSIVPPNVATDIHVMRVNNV